MPTDLKRDLGLAETTAIAVGAMVGSGIFILPGIAYVTAGSAAVLAFVIAAILVLPAALSAAEMATAIPEDGGPYLFVERGMGPLMGTIAGVGTWMMLSLKSALALVGGVPYLVYVQPTLAEAITALAIGLALFFTVVNLVSAEGSGKLQFGIVAALLVALAWLVVSGVPDVQADQVAGAFDPATEGILAATAIVFISYAGITKVPAVAEEVKNPGRNLPLAMVGALAIVAVLYATVVYVTIGVLDVTAAVEAGELRSDGEGAIIALVADELLGFAGVVVIVLAAILALASTANAGILAASRFPLAMARDGVFPSSFEQVSERFGTPANAVALTGALLLLLVTFFPIQTVASFGSAFQILVFILLNIALVGFREGAVSEYKPVFKAPLYPWLQLFGIIGGGYVLFQLGLVPALGALGIAALAAGWYFLYARHHVDSEGAARDAVRRGAAERSIERTRAAFENRDGTDVLVALTESTTPEAARDMTRIGLDISRLRGGLIDVVRFDSHPHRVFTAHTDRLEEPTGTLGDWLGFGEEPPSWFPMESAEESAGSRADGSGSRDTDSTTSRGDGGTEALAHPPEEPLRVEEPERGRLQRHVVSTENVVDSVAAYAAHEGIDLVLAERQTADLHRALFGGETAELLREVPCGIALVEDRGFDGDETLEEIAVVTHRGAYDPLKLLIADAIAEETNATISLLQAVPADPPATQRERIEDYHAELMRILTVPARSRIIEADDRIAGLARFATPADLLITATESRGLAGSVLGRPGDELVDRVDCTAVMVQPADEQHAGLVQRYLLSRIFGN
ncbi:APC family permease [Halorubrum vacuolatum]|uniref:Amino acid transporter n=1 Tax=Halorubrum vacuolatum TaxID=63740 RepID=A0A238VWT7_HALVU|nr:APC family permease [Halorubrum vacuolatum]SNR38756.1 Amino acid transporter [Halorubrum vacuolatum]